MSNDCYWVSWIHWKLHDIIKRRWSFRFLIIQSELSLIIQRQGEPGEVATALSALDATNNLQDLPAAVLLAQLQDCDMKPAEAARQLWAQQTGQFDGPDGYEGAKNLHSEDVCLQGRTTDDFHVGDHVCIQFGYFSNCRDVISAGKCRISMCLLCLPVFTRPAQTTTCSSTSSCSTRHERDVSVKSSKETRSEGQRWWEVCEHVMRPKKKSHLQSCALFGWRDLHSICTQTMISRIHISGTCLFWTLLRFQASIASRNCPSDEYYFTEFGALRCLEAKLYRCSM